MPVVGELTNDFRKLIGINTFCHHILAGCLLKILPLHDTEEILGRKSEDIVLSVAVSHVCSV